jgi:hypothetical protein
MMNRPVSYYCISLTVCLCLFVVSIFSESFTGIHPEHACYGDKCPVCLQLRWAQNFSGQLKSASLQAAFFLPALLTIRSLSRLVVFNLIPATSVTLKVKMNC